MENRLECMCVPPQSLPPSSRAGVLEAGYWDVEVEYAKASPNSVLVQVTVTNRGPKEDTLHVLPTMW